MCHKTFFNPRAMKIHEKRHSAGQTQKKCELCHKLISEKSFTTHMNEKHSSPRFECEFCLTTIGTKQNLEKHLNGVHRDLRKDCVECERKFTSKRSLFNHFLITHLTNYVCDICEDTFDRISNLQKHYQRVHKY